jgi:thiamine-monophosphate kinase
MLLHPTPGTVPADEVELIAALRGASATPPFQLNAPFEADAEIIDLGGDALLAVTVDTLHSGSELSMAPSAYARGWLAATATLSDLAAVGARPRALLLSCSFERESIGIEEARDIGRGVADAVKGQDAHVIGGDTNWADEESFTGCAIGVVEGGRPMHRSGAEAGDELYATGPVGAGNAAGVRGLLDDPVSWLPEARCTAGAALRGRANACIDTSDGLVSAALMLAEVNQLGVELVDEPAMYHRDGLELTGRLSLPNWMLAVGEWGEYELLYAVAPDDAEACARMLADHGAAPVRVGRLTEERAFTILVDGGRGGAVDALALADRLRALEPGAELLAGLLAVANEESDA